MTMDRALCGICAWRGDCNKKFMQGEGIHCPDYTRDLSIKSGPEEKGQEQAENLEVKAAKKKNNTFFL